MLPANFPLQMLSATQANRVQWFFKRYAEDFYSEYKFGHFLMAGYAAVPGMLTPDLLYRLWQNFNGYKWTGKPVSIHRVAVADILLSPLCNETGAELFEMEYTIRLAFLDWLKKEYETKIWRDREMRSIAEVASFVEEYYQTPNPGGQRWGDNYIEMQLLEASSYAEPEKAALVLTHKISQAVAANDETSLMQHIDVFSKAFQRLKIVTPVKDLERLHIFDSQLGVLEAGRQLIQQNNEGILNMLEEMPAFADLLTEQNRGGIAVQVPVPVISKMGEPVAPKMWVLVIGLNNFPANYLAETAVHGENDAGMVADCFKQVFSASAPQITVLTGKQATKEALLSALAELQKQSVSHDNIVVYISSQAVSTGETCYAACYDSRYEQDNPDYTSFLSAGEFATAVQFIPRRQFTLITEMAWSGIPQWLDLTVPGNAILSCCNAGQSPLYSETTKMDGVQCAYFTYELVRQLTKKSGMVSLREWMRLTLAGFEGMPQVRSVYGEELRKMQQPRLLASAESLNNLLIPDTRNRQTAALQSLLRQTGFYDGLTTGVMDEASRKSMEVYKSNVAENETVNNEAMLKSLANIKESKEHDKPVFLLIFSDPYRSLAAIKEEKTDIEKLLEPYAAKNNIELKILSDPSIEAVGQFCRDPEYRNRIRLFYFSGQDNRGDMALENGAYGFFEFARLFDFQENIHVLVSNTCRSALFTQWASQFGVALALGAADVVHDEFGHQFGLRFFQTIIARRPIEELLALDKPLTR
jgi:hypothetical protein